MTLHSSSTIQELRDALIADREAALSQVYKVFRNSYLSWVNRVNRDETLQIDSFQEAIITLYENVISNRVKEPDTTIKTYLFSIGRNKLLNAIKKEQHQSNLVREEQTLVSHDDTVDPKLKAQLEKGFAMLGERCRHILMRFYYDRYSLEAIMHEMEYQSENAVKSYKSRCLSKLRNLLKNKNKKLP